VVEDDILALDVTDEMERAGLEQGMRLLDQLVAFRLLLTVGH